MAILSFALLASALSTFVAAQESVPTALPAITGPGGGSCGGCYVVADVAGIVFGNEVLTQTNVQVVSVGVGNNGTNVTTIKTTLTQGQGAFTFAPTGLDTAGVPTSFNPFSSVITVAGATLTSPTSYEVFSAYSVTSTVSGPNGCQVVAGAAIPLSSAFKYPIAPNAGSDVLLEAESAFISFVGLPQCSAGGGTVQSTVHSLVSITTLNSTTVGPLRPTPVPISTVASPTALADLTTSGTVTGILSVITPTPFASVEVGTTVIVYPTGTVGATFTIIPFTGGAAGSSVGPSSRWAAPLAALVGAAVVTWWM